MIRDLGIAAMQTVHDGSGAGDPEARAWRRNVEVIVPVTVARTYPVYAMTLFLGDVTPRRLIVVGIGLGTLGIGPGVGRALGASGIAEAEVSAAVSVISSLYSVSFGLIGLLGG